MPRLNKRKAQLAKARQTLITKSQARKDVSDSFNPESLNRDHISGINEELLHAASYSDLSSEELSLNETTSDESDSEAYNYSYEIGIQIKVANDTETTPDLADNCSENIHAQLCWKAGAGESLKRPHGSDSESTIARRKRHQRELAQTALNTRSIMAYFKRQHGPGDTAEESSAASTLNPTLSHMQQGVPKAALQPLREEAKGRL